jgi:hypothetical protein
LWLQGEMLLADMFAVGGGMAAFRWRGRTYKVGVGGGLELLLGFGTDGSVCRASVRRRATQSRPDDIPGEKVPSNTWLISMIAGGCVRESKRGISGEQVKGPWARGEWAAAAARKERLRSGGGRAV